MGHVRMVDEWEVGSCVKGEGDAQVTNHWFRFCGVVIPKSAVFPNPYRVASRDLHARFVCERCGIERWYKYENPTMITPDGKPTQNIRRGARADECGSLKESDIQPISN